MIVYKITNERNGKAYVGQTTQEIRIRWNNHRCRKVNTLISKAIQKYGRENFTFEVIAEAATLQELHQMEIFNIAACRTLAPEGYNLAIGGGVNRGYHLSEETKAKVSAAQIGKRKPKRTKEHQSKLDASQIGRKRGPMSDEHKRKISAGVKARELSEESKEKLNQARRKPKPKSEDCKRKISQSLTGKIQSEETRKKRSESLKAWHFAKWKAV